MQNTHAAHFPHLQMLRSMHLHLNINWGNQYILFCCSKIKEKLSMGDSIHIIYSTIILHCILNIKFNNFFIRVKLGMSLSVFMFIGDILNYALSNNFDKYKYLKIGQLITISHFFNTTFQQKDICKRGKGNHKYPFL